MFVTASVLYFAFPKCASEWMRCQLNMQINREWNNRYDVHDWSQCDIQYCHAQPERFIREFDVPKDATLITIVRNTYDRLRSAYAYGLSHGYPYVTDNETFKQFIEKIHCHRHDLKSLPMAWMYLPVNEYFGDLVERVRFFQMDNLQELANFMEHNTHVRTDPDMVINSTYHQYKYEYDEDMVRMVQEVYRYELQRFKYEIESDT